MISLAAFGLSNRSRELVFDFNLFLFRIFLGARFIFRLLVLILGRLIDKFSIDSIRVSLKK